MRAIIPERDVHMFVNGLVCIIEGISNRVDRCDLCDRLFNTFGAILNIIEDGADDMPPWRGYTICPRCLECDRAELIATLHGICWPGTRRARTGRSRNCPTVGNLDGC